MDIIKNLKDYNLTAQQKIFASFLKENISAYSCSEKINNPEYIREYFAPENDFVIYTTGVANPSLLHKNVI